MNLRDHLSPEIIGILYAILTSIALMTNGVVGLVYATFIALLHYLIDQQYNKQQIIRSERLNEEMEWMIEKISSLLTSQQLKMKCVIRDILDRQNTEILGYAELGYERKPDPISTNPPQVLQSETLYTKLDERATILIGTNVFIPVLFGIIHLFRQVEVVIILFEIIIAILVTLLIIMYQPLPIELKGWKSNLERFAESEDQINVTGLRELITYKSFFHSPYLLEMGRQPMVKSTISADRVAASFLLVVTSLPYDRRAKVLSKLNEEFNTLSRSEELVQEKWRAYQSRIMIVSLASVAISALIASISTILVPIISISDDLVQTTPFLEWFILLLVITVNGLTNRYWFDRNEMIKQIILWIIIFVITLLLVESILQV